MTSISIGTLLAIIRTNFWGKGIEHITGLLRALDVLWEREKS